MILHYYLLCPGCNSKTLLRLQMGFDEKEPFYYVCQKCGAAVRGALTTNYKVEPPNVHLHMEDGVALQEVFDKPDQTITIALDLPYILFDCEYEDEYSELQSPFINQSILMEDRFLEFYKGIGTFRGIIKSDWPRVRRLITYYINRNWQQFDREWNTIFSDTRATPTNVIERHDKMHQVIELIFVSLQPEFDYLILKKELNNFISKVPSEKRANMRGFLRHLANTKDLGNYQRNLLERLAFTIDNFSALAPGFPALFYSDEGKRDISKVRIMRDDFEVLKIHYLSCFELSHKVLGILIGLLNISERGNADVFPGGKPKTLEDFNKLPNAQKPPFIDVNILPEIAHRWGSYYDRKLRNAIGHYSVYHDLKTGMLILDDAPPISYSEFVVSTLNLTPMLLYCLQLVKMIYIIDLLLK